MSIACDASEGIRIIGNDDPSKAFIRRLNYVHNRLCQVQSLYYSAYFYVGQYCEMPTLSSSESSSSSSDCLIHDCEEIVEQLYQIDDDDLTTEIYQSLDDLEALVCEIFRQATTLNVDAQTNCNPDEIESSSSSEAPPSSSESSSSEAPSSSDSSSISSESSLSSSSSQICCKEVIYIQSDCEDLGITEGIFLYGVATGNLDAPCEYMEFEQAFSSSSSSSSSGSSSSSISSSSSVSDSGSSVVPGLYVAYNPTENEFQIFLDGTLIALIPSMNYCEPYGTYPVTEGPCAGSTINIG